MTMKKERENLVIAVDGYSSCGKSTFAKRIARELGSLYIDSGAMYRAVTLLAIQSEAICDEQIDPDMLQQIIESSEMNFQKVDNGEYLIHLNGKLVEKEIRGSQVSKFVSPISKIGFVREKMVDLQRRISYGKGVVMDGRDIGTTVLPDADIKIFMTAQSEIRAKRRFEELKEKGYEPDLHEVTINITERDRIDESRDISPLRKAEAAFVLDNSNMTVDEQMEWFYRILESKLK